MFRYRFWDGILLFLFARLTHFLALRPSLCSLCREKKRRRTNEKCQYLSRVNRRCDDDDTEYTTNLNANCDFCKLKHTIFVLNSVKCNFIRQIHTTHTHSHSCALSTFSIFPNSHIFASNWFASVAASFPSSFPSSLLFQSESKWFLFIFTASPHHSISTA